MSDAYWPEVEARLRRALQNTKRSPLKDVVSAGLVPALVDPADLLAALARIEALEGERAWRPIESAPKDGTIFDVWFDDTTEQADVEFYCSPGTRRSSDWRWEDGKFRPACGLKLVTYAQPAHWQPHPGAPARVPDTPRLDPPIAPMEIDAGRKLADWLRDRGDTNYAALVDRLVSGLISAAPAQPGDAQAISEAILEAMCRAHDAEEAAQRGEPSPWEGYDPRGDENEFRICRIVAMRCALDAKAQPGDAA